jgi:hypothetical protein
VSNFENVTNVSCQIAHCPRFDWSAG